MTVKSGFLSSAKTADVIFQVFWKSAEIRP